MIALAIGAVALGALLAASTLTRLQVGRTWDDWQTADSPGWFTALQVVLVAMFLAGLFLRPVELAAVLIGVPGGFCLVYFSIGIRRRLRHEPRSEEPLDDDPPEPWYRKVAWFAGSLVIALVVGYLVGLRGLELVGISVFLVLVVIGSEKLGDRIAVWIRG